jgi:hypothetical protein
MYSSAELSIVAQYLQMECPTRWIQFRDSGFYLGDHEVTGERFIADFHHLRFGQITRAGNRIVAVREGRFLRSCFLQKPMPRAEAISSFFAEAQKVSGADAESVVILGLEHYDSGARANFLADTAEGKAALGALCNLCARRARNGAPIVTLASKKLSWRCAPPDNASSGTLSREPLFDVLDWESGCGSPPLEDDIPF